MRTLMLRRFPSIPWLFSPAHSNFVRFFFFFFFPSLEIRRAHSGAEEA
jgi:hypothetical protein